MSRAPASAGLDVRRRYHQVMLARRTAYLVASLAVGSLVACASGVVDDTAGVEAEQTAQGTDASVEGNAIAPSSTPDVITPDADASSTPDADASSDASPTPDAANDAGPTITFGTSCSSPSVYTDTFATDPLGSRWTPIVGSVTHPAAGQLALAAGSPNTQAWIGLRPSWTNYTVSVPVRIDTAGASANGGITFRMMSVGTANDSGQMYYAGLTPTGVVLGSENTVWTHYAAAAGTFGTGVFYTLTVTVNGNALSVSASGGGGGQVTASYTDTAASFPTGSIGFRTFNMGMTYGSVTVTCN